MDLDTAIGILVGNAVGDALGAPAEFKGRNVGVKKMERAGQTLTKAPGCYTDDTEMAVALGLAILEAGGFSTRQIINRFVMWYNTHPPDVGCHTSTVLNKYKNLGASSVMSLQDESFLSSIADSNKGNGSIMRFGVLPAYTQAFPRIQRLYMAKMQGALTHQSTTAVDCCAIMEVLCDKLAVGHNMSSIIDNPVGMSELYGVCEDWRTADIVLTDIEAVEDVGDLPNTGYCVDTLVRAVWPLYKGMPVREGLLACINQGGDADSAGAVCGALYGAQLGFSGLSDQVGEWVQCVLEEEKAFREIGLIDLATQLYGLGEINAEKGRC